VVILGDIFEHVNYVKVPGKTFKPIHKKLKTGLYKDENEVLHWLVHKKAEQKKDYYCKKISEMEQKYNMDFSVFENRIHLKARQENLEECNDLILWGGYVKACRYWEQFC
jgi:hypothetical protein